MKKFIKFSLVAAAFLSTTALRANENNLNLTVTGGNEKVISFSVDKAEDVNVLLLTTNKEVLFQEDFHADAATIKKYDLNALPDGTYFLKVSSNASLLTYKIVIKNGEAGVSTPSVVAVLAPIITKQDGAIVLNMIEKDKSPIEIDVYNESNELLYSKVFTDTTKVKRIFDVTNTDVQSLTFVVKANNQNFTKTIALN